MTNEYDQIKEENNKQPQDKGDGDDGYLKYMVIGTALVVIGGAMAIRYYKKA